MRACGLELTFHLAKADLEDHDLTLIERALERTPAQRIEHAVTAARTLDRLWPRRVAG